MTAQPKGEREASARRFGRRVQLVSGAAAVVIAILLGVLVMARAGTAPFDFDEEWAEDLVELRGPIGDVVAFGMNTLGGGLVAVFVVPSLAAIVLLFARRPWAALYFIVASALSAGVVQVLKQSFRRARPEDILIVSDTGAFPSGHVSNAATIALALAVIVPTIWVWAAGAAYTVLMAVSRTYLGAHWVTDTIGGALVGAGVALVLWALFATQLERERLAWADRAAKSAEARAQASITPPRD